jgi:transcriptional regulator with XRE-family HTH domain
MRIDSNLTDDAVLHELGARLERTRLERNLSQRQLGDEAGVERKAVQRIEAGQPVKLTSFIRVLRALGLLDELERLVPEPVPSPIQLLELKGRTRQRATGERHTGPAESAEAAVTREQAPPWRWGDEQPDAQL